MLFAVFIEVIRQNDFSVDSEYHLRVWTHTLKKEDKAANQHYKPNLLDGRQ